MRPFGEVVASPFEVGHTEGELKELARFLKSLPGETRVLMEYTGRYYEPIAQYLNEAGIFVSVINAIREIIVFDDEIHIYFNSPLQTGPDASQGLSVCDRETSIPAHIQNSYELKRKNIRLTITI